MYFHLKHNRLVTAFCDILSVLSLSFKDKHKGALSLLSQQRGLHLLSPSSNYPRHLVLRLLDGIGLLVWKSSTSLTKVLNSFKSANDVAVMLTTGALMQPRW